MPLPTPIAALTVTTYLYLDGVLQAPGSPDEDVRGGFTLGGWMVPFVDWEMSDAITETFAGASAFLFGRTTFQLFVTHWQNVHAAASGT